MSSDVCKHCTHAACLDVCPTGSLFRTEFGTVVVQEDICNGCGYCVPACPYGVIERRSGPEGAKNVGIAQKCTLCYDRLGAGQTPACAQACPTQSIQFGDVEELRERAAQRVEKLHDGGVMDARLYGDDPNDGVGGAGAFFLLLDEPEVYGLPPDPVVTTRDLPQMFNRARPRRRSRCSSARCSSFVGRRAMSAPGRDRHGSASRDGRPHAAGASAAAASSRWCPRRTFTSYYGLPIVKPSPWKADIPAYLFSGGLAAGSSLLAAGARPHRPAGAAPRRPARRRSSALTRHAWRRWSTTSAGRRASSTCCGRSS